MALRNRLVVTATAMVLLLADCASTGVKAGPSVLLDGLSIDNQTAMFISAVRLLIPANGNFVSCGNIPPHTACSTTFPERAYSGQAVEITWSQAGQIHSTGSFDIRVPEGLDPDRPALVKVVISGADTAGALIVQAH